MTCLLGSAAQCTLSTTRTGTAGPPSEGWSRGTAELVTAEDGSLTRERLRYVIERLLEDAEGHLLVFYVPLSTRTGPSCVPRTFWSASATRSAARSDIAEIVPNDTSSGLDFPRFRRHCLT